MTPKCGRIDVKYANCSYHTRIGLGKWTHDPTLVTDKSGDDGDEYAELKSDRRAWHVYTCIAPGNTILLRSNSLLVLLANY